MKSYPALCTDAIYMDAIISRRSCLTVLENRIMKTILIYNSLAITIIIMYCSHPGSV